MYRLLVSALLACSLSLPLASQPPAAAPQVPPGKAHVVDGLKLPAPQTVPFDEGYINLSADTKGTVKWLVLSTSTKLKFRVSPTSPNEITVAVPPYETSMVIFAIAQVDGKMTDFARTEVNVTGGTKPPDNPPANVKLPLHLSIVEDPGARTPAIRAIIDDPALRDRLKSKQILFRAFATADKVDLQRFRFDGIVATHGVPVMILQDNDGKALVIQRLPADQAELLKILAPYVGGF